MKPSGHFEAGHRADARPALASTPGPEPIAPRATRWLRRSDQLLVAWLLACVLVLMGVHWIRLTSWGLKPVEIERFGSEAYAYRLDINTATRTELIQLDGIGPALAQRIIDDRNAHGPFGRVADLARVKGIGPKTVEALRPWLRPAVLDFDGEIRMAGVIGP